MIDRGTVSGKRNWSSQGGQIGARLDVSGIATNNNGRSDSQTITIDLYRCFYNYTTHAQGSCYAQTISVTVNRAPKPDPAPVYSFDGATCSTASGWILDKSRPDQSMAAHVQVDGDTKVWGTTDQRRDDVNAVYGVSGNHGFSIDISKWVADTGSHTVEVFTYNLDSSGNTTGGPISIGRKTVSDCYNYDVYPRTTTESKIITYGQTATINAGLFNNGTTRSKHKIPRTVYEFVLDSGESLSDYIPNDPNALKLSKLLKNSETVDYIEPPIEAYHDVGTVGCIQWASKLGITKCTMPGVEGETNGIAAVVLASPDPARPDWQSTGVDASVTTISADNYDVGQTVCRFLATRIFDEAHEPAGGVENYGRRVSWPACVKIGKKPKVQIWGGDLTSLGGASTSVSSKSIDGASYTFGSWVEYGIFATGTVTGTGSGAAYAGQGLVDATVCKESQLSFTNAVDDSSGCKDNGTIGHYVTSRSVPDVAASFPVSSTTPTIGSDYISDPTRSGVFTASGAVTLDGGTLQKGRWLVLNAPNADVTINGNITYTIDSLHSIYEIPQLVIIAKNIIIADGVTQIDAWLIAKGSSPTDGIINTCASVGTTGPLSTEICNLKLVVNGPVMADKLYLRRTYGSNPCVGSDCSPSGEPAEIFNLRPDAYLWASGRSIVSGRLQTVYTTELPPRL
jgi:hypothetical protein